MTIPTETYEDDRGESNEPSVTYVNGIFPYGNEAYDANGILKDEYVFSPSMRYVDHNGDVWKMDGTRDEVVSPKKKITLDHSDIPGRSESLGVLDESGYITHWISPVIDKRFKIEPVRYTDNNE